MEKKPAAKTATKKKTTKKPASVTKSGAPRKPYTKKPKIEEPVENKTVEPVAPKTEDGLVDERTARIEFGKMLEKDEKIPFVIPFDPENPQDPFWECGFNDLILRYPRGVVQYQPRYIVDFILKKLDDYEKERRKTAQWQGSGKRIDF